MQTPLSQGEDILKEGPANLQRGLETVGGRLCLTNQRLIFEAHNYNFQSGATLIPLSTVTGTRKSWTKLLNLIPLMPNSLAVATNEGKVYNFVLFERQKWSDAIAQMLTAV